ncbi:MAG: hydantoinase/oxoprolinase family protein, partial [Acidobacteria bacterium]|nr:hydantoinase/oxoprolinase family protein [Acidobacteriota bacterium]
MQDSPPWQVWVDTGGTFTDCVALDPQGHMRRAKVLSSSALRGSLWPVVSARVRFDTELELPDGFFRGATLRRLAGGGARIADSVGSSGELRLENELGGLRGGEAGEVVFDEEAPILAARVVTSTAAGDPLPTLALRLGTTRGTNALLERSGPAVALFVTAGFRDLLAIGTQRRDDLFAVAIEKEAPLCSTVIEVEERLAADGSVVRPLKLESLRDAAAKLLSSGADCAAIALLHSYRNPAHEQAVAALLREMGFRHVSVSCELAARIQILPRAETAVVNAYLSSTITSYLEGVQGAIGAGTLHVMTSAGGLISAAQYEPKDSLLSGPAGGVVGAASAGRASGERSLIAFDMGGTSTDVSRIGERLDYRHRIEVGGVRLMAPALAIETVAAGGGSICWFDGSQVRVGPQSAGASPG